MLKAGDHFYKVYNYHNDDGERCYILVEILITKVTNKNIYLNREDFKDVWSVDYFNDEGMWPTKEEAISAFSHELLREVFDAEDIAIRRRNEYFNFRATLGRTLPDGRS